MAPPRGPVFLSIPEDDWDRPAALVGHRPRHDDFTASPAALGEIAAALAGAHRPALVIGAGVDGEGAQELAVDLAERVTAAVWITPLSARSGFPENHRLFQGFLPPVRDRIAETLAGHDVVLSLGGPIVTYHVPSAGPYLPPGTRLFHLDCDPREAAWAPVGTTVLSTVRAGLAALLDLVEKRFRPDPPPRPRPAPAPRQDPIGPALAIDTLRAVVPDDVVVVEEIPSHREQFHARFQITRPGGFLTTGSGTLGWGLPLAVGRALAGGGERVVCVAGDGSSMYSIQAIWSAVRYRAPVTFVIFDNHGYEAVKQLGRRLGTADLVGTDIHRIDFATLAMAMGCPGTAVPNWSKLEGDLAHGVSMKGPFVVVVPIAEDGGSAYPENG